MLGVHAKIEALEIAHTCAQVGYFVDGDRFAKGGAAGEERHREQKGGGEQNVRAG